MNDLAECIETEIVNVPENGVLALKIDLSNKTPIKAAALLDNISEQLGAVRHRLPAPVIIVPKGVKLETMTHDEMRVLGII